MEESGHYYTVYYTSLAVGFANDIAQRQALLTQMPDEVGWLDAANMHIDQCANRPVSYTAAFIFGPVGEYIADNHFMEYNLEGKKQRVPADWRYTIEFALHSLKDPGSGVVSSKNQRKLTRDLLINNAPDSLAFGLLLHRLGDTYAHSIMNNESQMYTTTKSDSITQCVVLESLGHARDGHNPDYPYKRQDLFFEYLKDLYDILKTKFHDSSISYKKRKIPLSFDELKNAFASIFQNLKSTYQRPNIRIGRGGMMMTGGPPITEEINPELVIKDFIAAIRSKCFQTLQVNMDKYAPETIEKQTLGEFLNDHPDLKKIIDANKLEAQIKLIHRQLDEHSGSW